MSWVQLILLNAGWFESWSEWPYVCSIRPHLLYIIEFALENQILRCRNNLKSEMNDTPFVHCVLMLHFIGRCSTFSHRLSMHTKNCGPIGTDVHFSSDTDFYYCVHCWWPHNLWHMAVPVCPVHCKTALVQSKYHRVVFVLDSYVWVNLNILFLYRWDVGELMFFFPRIDLTGEIQINSFAVSTLHLH